HRMQAAAIALVAALSGGALAGTQYAAETFFADLLATTPLQAGNPLFPAGTKIDRPGEWKDAPGSDSCGEAGCHPEIVSEWQRSSHATAATNPEYEVSLRDARSRLWEDGVRWCAGCHAPLSLVDTNRKSKIKNQKSV